MPGRKTPFLPSLKEGSAREMVTLDGLELHCDHATEGLRWLGRGAPQDEAKMRYMPEELTCLIDGLRAYIVPRIRSAGAP